MPDINSQYADPARGDYPAAPIPESHVEPIAADFAEPRSFVVLDANDNNMYWDGEKLRSLMQSRGLTQMTLASKIGISRQPTISDWVNGQTPSAPYVFRLAAVLGVDIHALFSHDARESSLSAGFDRQIADRQRQYDREGY